MYKNDPLARWKRLIIDVGIFLIFLVTFGDYVFGKVWPVLQKFVP
jgi:hypothetical protein